MLVKLNQIGTLTETLDAVRVAPTQSLQRGDLAPIGRDRGRDDCGLRGGDQRRPDKNWRAGTILTGSRSTISC